MAKKSSKAKSAEEAQLEAVLNHIRKHSVTMTLPDALRRRITARLSMLGHKMYDNKFAVHDVIEFSLAALMCQSLREARLDRLLTGFVYLWLRYCSVMKRGCSEHDAYHALVELSTAEEILHLLQRHNLPAARASAFTSPHILQILTRLQQSISEKTAGRYEDKARISVINFLSDCLSDLYGLIAGQPAGESSMPSDDSRGPDVHDDFPAARDLASLIHDHTRIMCATPPASFGICIPISECISRSVHTHRGNHAIASEYLPNYLFERCATIAGLTGSGLTTLLLKIALLGNAGNVNACHFYYTSLAKYADYMHKGYHVAQFMAAELDADAFEHPEQRLQLVARIEQALVAGRLVVLADEISCLPGSSHEAVVAELAIAKSVCFAVSKSGAAELHALMSRHMNRDILCVSLDDLGLDGQEMLARLAAAQMHIPYQYNTISAAFDGWNRTEGTTPLGVMAGLQTHACSIEARHLLFAQTLLNECLRRQRHPELILPQQACQLDDFARSLIHLGGAAIAGTVPYLPEPFDPEVDVRRTIQIYEDVLENIASTTIDDLLSLRIISKQRSQPFVQFVHPCIEELSMTLYYFYVRGGRRLKREFILPGGNTPLIRRAQRSSALVPQLIAWQNAQ